MGHDNFKPSGAAKALEVTVCLELSRHGSIVSISKISEGSKLLAGKVTLCRARLGVGFTVHHQVSHGLLVVADFVYF